jgi:2-keto-4-pentenoate hydratase/2-oxohepta-3-ene-1,7-dioic acid hydratase in catechol pathway
MKLISYEVDGRATYGLLVDDRIVDLGRRLGHRAPTLKALIATGEMHALAVAHLGDAADHRLADVRLLPVIPQPATIACVGHNYEAHRVETQRDPTAQPSIFFRHPESLQGDGAPLVRPRESEQLDYEGELAVVIGTPGRRIAEADAWKHVAGLSCFNDGSVRDFQHHTRQFGPGKNFAHTAGFGPALVTLDELPPDQIFELRTRVNGQLVQQARTDQLTFPHSGADRLCVHLHDPAVRRRDRHRHARRRRRQAQPALLAAAGRRDRGGDFVRRFALQQRGAGALSRIALHDRARTEQINSRSMP